MKKKLLLTGAYQYTQDQIKKLENADWEITFLQNERERICIPVDSFEAVVCNGLFLYNDIREFKSLKVVQATSAGLDRMPTEYMEEHGIRCYNAKGVYSIPMAEWAIMNILQLSKSAPVLYDNQKKHHWNKERSVLELTDKHVAIIGFGDVGREIARRLRPFGVEISAINRSEVHDDDVDEWIELEKLNQALKNADIVVITIALTKDTYHLLGKEQFDAMKDDSILLNMSRGEVICERDLITTLESKKFRGVALDVFAEEPLVDNSPLWDFENVIITPHNSFVSDKVHARLFDVIYNNLCQG